MPLTDIIFLIQLCFRYTGEIGSETAQRSPLPVSMLANNVTINTNNLNHIIGQINPVSLAPPPPILMVTTASGNTISTFTSRLNNELENHSNSKQNLPKRFTDIKQIPQHHQQSQPSSQKYSNEVFQAMTTTNIKPQSHHQHSQFRQLPVVPLAAASLQQQQGNFFNKYLLYLI